MTAGGAREARERAQAFADAKPGFVTAGERQLARDVLSLAAALAEAEQRAEEAERREQEHSDMAARLRDTEEAAREIVALTEWAADSPTASGEAFDDAVAIARRMLAAGGDTPEETQT